MDYLLFNPPLFYAAFITYTAIVVFQVCIAKGIGSF